MRLRTAQLACLLLLLTSIGAAEASARETSFSVGGHYITTLLRQSASAEVMETPLSRRLDQPSTSAHANVSTGSASVWTMRPPSAHSVRLQAVTGSGL